MRTCSLTVLLLFGTGVAALAQSAPVNSGTISAGGGADKPVTTIKTNARLVVLDIVVKDGKGRPVHGLKASDFTLLEDNAPQTVSHFEEHVAATMDALRMPAVSKLPPGIFTNYSPAASNGVSNVVLLDTMNTPLIDQTFVREQLLAFLKTIQPGTRLAIFGLNQRLVLLQGFTTDPDVLRAALTKTRGKTSPLLDDATGGGGIQNSTADNMEDNGADPEVVANLRQFEAETQSFQQQLRAKYTLDAMNQLARYLARIPGRKNLIWFSGSFPVNIMPDMNGTLPDPFATMADSAEEFRQTVTMLAASQVAVYPVDARGLMTSSVYSAATDRNYTGPRGGMRAQQDLSSFFMQTAAEQGTMRDLAAGTGGRAFVNTNGLAAAVASAIQEGSNFYSIAYVPTNSAQNGKLRKISVRVDQPNVTLEYRPGYYAEQPGKPETAATRVDAATATGRRLNAHDSLYLAMMRGAPSPTEILMKVGVVPITPAGQTEDKVADGNQVVGKMQPPYRRYSVNYLVDPADLSFVLRGDGKVYCDVDLIILVYTPEGQIVNGVEGDVHIAAPLDEVKKAAAKGLVWHEEVSTPAKGEYFLRIGVKDEHKNQFGAVEVATSQVRNMVPVSAPATVAPSAPAK